MKTEENKRMLALSCIVADMKAENMELVERVQQLVDEYNEVARQLNGKDKRKDKNSKPTLGEFQQMREQCEHLKIKNKELERFEKAMHEFVKDKNIYMKNDSECPYHPDGVSVCSTSCLECDSCLGVIEGVGVICDKRLAESCAVFPSYD